MHDGTRVLLTKVILRQIFIRKMCVNRCFSTKDARVKYVVN